MNTASTTPRITVYRTDQQASGSFDGGKITEIKPIGFPGERGAVERLGPLFYWAWATAHGEGKIGLHPHQGFEIASYVLSGELGHYDTLGTRSRVGAGGAQIMRTGSGVSHEETMHGLDRTDFFQVWFEPDMEQAIELEPTYQEVRAEQAPVRDEGGAKIRTIIAPEGPGRITVDARLEDVTIRPGTVWRRELNARRALGIVAAEGTGELRTDESVTPIDTREFAVVDGGADGVFTVHAGGQGLRLIVVEVPTHVDYPLYRKRRA